jgi:hypothetical protein
VDRTTVFRWETQRARPESAELVQAVAEALGVDLDEALAAAGLKPGIAPPVEPTREHDEEMEMILTAPVDPATKKKMVDRLLELRERDKQRRMEDLTFLLERARPGRRS